MEYDVIITDIITIRLQEITSFLIFKTGDLKAAKDLMDDFVKTIERLKFLAGSLPNSNDIELAKRG